MDRCVKNPQKNQVICAAVHPGGSRLCLVIVDLALHCGEHDCLRQIPGRELAVVRSERLIQADRRSLGTDDAVFDLQIGRTVVAALQQEREERLRRGRQRDPHAVGDAGRVASYPFSPPVVARDSYGNTLGGIRLATMEVPIALNNGTNAGAGLCFLNGTHIPFDPPTLDALYPTHGGYVSAVDGAATASVTAGFVLPEDTALTLDDAVDSVVGFGLLCGPLCADVSQFPKGPSTSLLHAQTAPQDVVDGDVLLEQLSQATQWVATGYSYGSGPKGQQSFAKAIAALTRYVARRSNVSSKTAAWHWRPAYSFNEANTLITALRGL
jgi:hypothetical protein